MLPPCPLLPSESGARTSRPPPAGAGQLQRPRGRDLAALPGRRRFGEAGNQAELSGTLYWAAPGSQALS